MCSDLLLHRNESQLQSSNVSLAMQKTNLTFNTDNYLQ